VGYGREVWTAGGYYFWIPIVAPFAGAVSGGLAYDLCLYTGSESPVNGGLGRKKKEGFSV